MQTKFFSAPTVKTGADAEGKWDVSSISTDDVDRDGDIVLPGGIDTSDFMKNPTVFYCHDYTLPVGRCAYVRPVGNGLAAKTIYARKPSDWEGPWLADQCHAMIQQGIAIGKSIGFQPLNRRAPTPQELQARPDWRGASIIDRANLLEYSVRRCQRTKTP